MVPLIYVLMLLSRAKRIKNIWKNFLIFSKNKREKNYNVIFKLMISNCNE